MSCADQEEETVNFLQNRVQHLIQTAIFYFSFFFPPLSRIQSCASTKPSLGILWELH